MQITATSGDETYAVLEKRTENGNIIYSTDLEQNLPPLPTETFNVEVPGAAFPAFTETVPGAGAALDLTGPEDLTNITPTSTFSRTAVPVEDATSYVTLSASQTLGEERSVVCSAF